MRKLLLLALFLTSATIFAQGTLTGTVIDSSMDGPLPGATVMVEGTNNGTTTDFDGNFSLNVDSNSGKLKVSFVGYTTKTINFNLTSGPQDLGEIILIGDASALDEVVVTSFALAIDRKTPVAVSTVKAEEIEMKLGNQEFPEILKTTPGVYVTKQGGGFGDSSIRLRGFNSENIAVMINGVPVNDMENGRVYWSNWAGLSDVTRTMQVQRGLGASRLAVPSIGGTINIVTKTTDMEKGGNVMMATGNDGYQKYGATVSTGLLESGWAATVSASKTTGNGYIDGTEFEGYNYFVNIAKQLGEDHELSFTAFGAPQRHGQRQNRQLIQTYRESDRDLKFNSDWGYMNGQVKNTEDNFYHKPQLSLNHSWIISDRTELSTALYASVASGGGGGYAGVNKFGLDSEYRDGYLQPVNFDMIVDDNVERGALGSETILRASRNNHNWYGALSTLSTDLTDDIELIGGVDLRYYKGEHYTELTDLLGGQYWLDDSNVNNTTNVAQVGDIIDYYDEGTVLWGGVFGQAEYSKDDLSAFIALAASNTAYKREDFFSYLASDPDRETDYQNFFGYSAKGGANYNLSDSHNVFANVGYFEKAPFFDAVFLNFVNDINADAQNQKVFSAEVGYGFRSSKFTADFNVYRTLWQDRTETQSFQNPEEGGNPFVANILGIDALHQGVELEFAYRPFDELTITGMGSIGDWTWQNDVTDVKVFDDQQNEIATIDIFLEGVKVANAAQTTFAFGADYEILPGTNLWGDFTYADNFYADFNPSNRNTAGVGQAWKAPSFGLLDLGLGHSFEFGGFDTRININVNNVLDTEYIADAADQSGTADRALVWYGFGRTYTVGAKINF